MSGFIRISIVLAVLAGVPRGLCAAQPAAGAAPRVSIVHAGADRLLEDTQYMLSLTDEDEREQWEVIEQFFEEIFLLGVDRKRPVRMDLVFGDGPLRYVPAFPIADLEDFRDNLAAFGIESRRLGGTYTLKDAFEGYMRYKHGYAFIGEEKEDVPLSLPNPLQAVGPLLEADYDAAAELVNTLVTEADQKVRRDDFQKSVRDELLAALARRPDESAEEYALRKLTVEQQLEELERYYVESGRAMLGWTTDVEKGDGWLDVRLDPLPGTALHGAVQKLSEEPSYFARVARMEDPMLSARVKHPLDEMRQRHFTEFYTLARPTVKAEVGEWDGTDAEKQARDEIVDQVLDRLLATTKLGLADGFVEARTSDDGQRIVVGGMRVDDGLLGAPVIDLMPKAWSNVTVKKEVATHGDVVIHELTIPKGEIPFIDPLFGGTETYYAGISKEALWFAAGTGSLAELKQAIDVAGKTDGVEPGPFVDVRAQLSPWMQIRAELAEAGEGDEELRKLALEALTPEDDEFSLKLTRVDEHVEGKLDVGVGVLRLAGKLMAKFSKENLE